MKTTQGGGGLVTSTGGTLTARGSEHIIIDDPIKPGDATSPESSRTAAQRDEFSPGALVH